MISEPEFKTRLLEKLNVINPGWADGDLDNSREKKADIVNNSLQIAIEIKDDTLYKALVPMPGRMIGQTNDLKQKNRQFKDDLKSANKKFINYPSYKTILILRTDMADRTTGLIDYIINGLKTFKKDGNELVYVGRPNTYFSDEDNSISEVGAIIFWGNNQIVYGPNNNPNFNKARFLDKDDIENILDITMVGLDVDI